MNTKQTPSNEAMLERENIGAIVAMSRNSKVTDSGKAPSVKRYQTQARVTQFVNADNKLRFCVSIVNEGLVPHQDEGRVLGQYDNAKDAQLRAATYNNHGI